MLRPSVETERLSTVQRAARHALDKAARGESDFGSMEIFPPDAPKALTGSTEYIWRAQLAWTWSKAGFFSCKILGRGIGKHRSYALLPEGREALERIANDPRLASFYIKAKRNTVSEGYPPEWFRPEDLRVLEEREEEEEEEEEGGEGEEDEAPESGESASGDREGDREGASVERDRRWDLMIGVLEKVSTQFGDLRAEIVSLKAEVKAQSDFVLEVSQKIETSARPDVTKDDLGRVSAEIVAAIISEKSKDKSKESDLFEALHAIRSKVFAEEPSERPNEKLSASIAAIGTGILGLGAEIATLSKRGKSVEELEVFIAGRFQSLRDDLKSEHEEFADIVTENFGLVDERLGKLDRRVGAAVAKAPDLSEFKGDLDGLKEDLSSVREDVEGLLESIDVFDKGFISRLEEYKKQGSATNETFVRVTEGVQDILRATRAVCSAMVEVSMQRSVLAGASPEEIRKRAEGVVENVEAASSAIKGRVSSLGAGLIKNVALDADVDVDLDGDAGGGKKKEKKGVEEEES